MNRTEILKQIYRVCTWWIQRVLTSCGQAVTSTQQQQQQQQQQRHLAALEQHSIRAALVPLLVLFFYCCVLLRTARAALERTSMSRFPSLLHRKKKGHGTTITRLLQHNEHETNTRTTWPSSHEHSAAAAAVALSGTRATLDSSSTRTPVVAVVSLLRTARA